MRSNTKTQTTPPRKGTSRQTTQPKKKKIGATEMKAALQRSGYLLESRIGKTLQERGFYVEFNTFTADPRQEGQLVELDVLGNAFQWINEDDKSTVSANLRIECKNNQQPVVFFVNQQQVPELNESRINYRGWPQFVWAKDDQRIPTHRLLKAVEWHHYCAAKEVATQFCSFKDINEKNDKKPSDWKAEAMPHYSQSFGNLCLSVNPGLSAQTRSDSGRIQLELYYPIVVFQGPIYVARTDSSKFQLNEVESLQLHFSALAVDKTIQAQIDVVSENAFETLVDNLLQELGIAASRCQAVYAQMKSAGSMKPRKYDRRPVRMRYGST